MKKYIIGAIIFASTLFIDIITKQIVVAKFGLGERLDFFGGFLRITLVYNEGGVFGIMQGYKNLFLIVSMLVLLLMVAYYIMEKNKTILFTSAMAMIASGAVGNIIDRLIKERPGVVDFISVGVDNVYRWHIFNMADAFIVTGAGLLIIVFYQNEKKAKIESKEINSNQ